MNVGCTTHRSQPLQLSISQSFYMPQVNGLIPLKGHTSVVINCKNDVSFICVFIFTTKYSKLKIIHIDWLFKYLLFGS